MIESKSIKQLQIGTTIILITLLMVVTAVVFTYKKNRQDLAIRDQKLSAMITEIGELKNENEKIIQSITSENTKLVQLQPQINQLTANSKNSKELEAMKNNLITLTAERKNLVNELTAEKQSRAAPVTPVQKNPAITTILILGTHGNLTDTIILLTINKQTQKNILVSIPRDLYYNGRRINELFERYGIQEVEKVIGIVTGYPPDKYIVIDLDSFVDLVDAVGGVDINVEKDLIDYSYPGPKLSYKTVSFKKGLQHFDGKTALIYARSRKSTSDFDRSLRQQEIIAAFKEKIKTLNMTDNLISALKIYDKLKNEIQTDISPLEALWDLRNYQNYTIKGGNVLTTSNYLFSTTGEGGAYILLPIKKDFSAIKNYINNLVNN